VTVEAVAARSDRKDLRGRAVDVLPVYGPGNGIDVVVLGVASRRGLAKWVRGNTAGRILDKLPCSVLTVRAGWS
jgi:nucleotide-binding universal stress UspA family protein